VILDSSEPAFWAVWFAEMVLTVGALALLVLVVDHAGRAVVGWLMWHVGTTNGAGAAEERSDNGVHL
jgi:hypothetical protein